MGKIEKIEKYAAIGQQYGSSVSYVIKTPAKSSRGFKEPLAFAYGTGAGFFTTFRHLFRSYTLFFSDSRLRFSTNPAWGGLP